MLNKEIFTWYTIKQEFNQEQMDAIYNAIQLAPNISPATIDKFLFQIHRSGLQQGVDSRDNSWSNVR